MQRFDFNYIEDLKSFLQPLKKCSPINYFEHSRIYKDGRSFIISTAPEFLTHFLKNKYSRPSPEIYTNSGIFLWSAIPGLYEFDKQLVDMFHFGIDHGISFVSVHEQYIDICDFAASPESYFIANFYLNNLKLLEGFIKNYKEQFLSLIQEHEKSTFNIPLRPQHFSKKICSYTSLETITSRELNCIELFAQGYTAKTTAKKLGIAPRTVERHFENIKYKLNLHSKSELLSLLFEFKFIKSKRAIFL